MILKVQGEYRGFTSKKSDNGNVYTFVNIEDEYGEGCKISCDKNVNLDELQKGDKLTFLLEYNTIYKSLKFVGYEV